MVLTGKKQSEVSFNTGSLSQEALEAILDVLPIDLSFVNKDDEVQYFNKLGNRVFPRTKDVVGRKVQNCHPPKSLDKVNRILADFKAGKRNAAIFWINLGERLVYIRYFAVRSKSGEYLGCLEVTQDVSAIKKLEGEKRLD